MGLADERESFPRRVLASPQLPQWTVAAQRRRHHLVYQAGKRTWRLVEVTVDRERLVVDPLGGGQPERYRRELLALARRARQPSLDVIAQLVEAGQLPRRRR